MMIGFKAVLLLSFVFGFHTFKYGLSKIWVNHSYLRELSSKCITNSVQHNNYYKSDECCQLVKYDCNNDIIIKETNLSKNKKSYLVNSFIDNDTIYNINSNTEINTFMEPINIIMWAS